MTIVNNGALSLAKTVSYTFAPYGAIVAGSADVTNNGTITVNNADNLYYPAAAIFGGTNVTNAGTITLVGGSTTITGAADVVNTGTISATGSQTFGITGFHTLDNSGSIEVDAIAVAAGYGSSAIINSGRITSRLGSAVVLDYGSTLINNAGGQITGSPIAIDVSGGGTVINRGIVNGDVAASPYSYGSAVYVADGGTVTGNVSFGAGYDAFIVLGANTGVSGMIDGGDGLDTFGRVLTRSDNVSLAPPSQVINFERTLVGASGGGTVATITSSAPFTGDVFVGGDGAIVNTATINGDVRASLQYANAAVPSTYELAAFDNRGTVNGSVSGPIISLVNSGALVNASGEAVDLSRDGSITLVNAGTISGTVLASAGNNQSETAASLTVTNNGSIEAAGTAVSLSASSPITGSMVSFTNGGTVTANDSYRSAEAVAVSSQQASIVNSGAITAAAAPMPGTVAVGVAIFSYGVGSASLTNTATGSIVASGDSAYGVSSDRVALTLDNAGTITGGTTLADGTSTGAAIDVYGTLGSTIHSTGTINGAIFLTDGTDLLDNAGVITGPASLGAGDDTVVQRGGGVMGGQIDGGNGNDAYQVDATGSVTVATGSQLTNFERLFQTGPGVATYAGTYAVPTIELQGGTVVVAAGHTLSTLGTTTVTGGNAGTAVSNAGTITGGIALGDGRDSVVNTGLIAGPVSLGGGDDSYTEGPGSSAAQGVDGGLGIDTYHVLLAGDRSGIGARAGFEQLAITGPGVLSLSLDQDFTAISISGGGLALALARHSVGRIDGSALDETLALDGAVGPASLGAGDDALTIAGGALAGQYDGGAGNDSATLILANDYTLRPGTLTGFERLASLGAPSLTLAGGAMAFDSVSIAGDLTIAADASLTAPSLVFGPADNQITIAGDFAGSVDGGAGTNRIRVSGGNAANPVAFADIANVEGLAISGGYTTISGRAELGGIDLTGGRLVGLAGSSITAPAIIVGAAATFGSAGVVTGNVAVSGTLSPGASPGTMTINGNVLLASGSVSVFDITPTIADQLLINGSLKIASGATLELDAEGAAIAGRRIDLIVAGQGISGSFTTIVKPASLFGIIIQQSNRIELLGDFENSTAFTPQVQRSIAYLNGVLESGHASDVLIAAAPKLVTETGGTNVAAFARISPEAFASAQQIEVENGLALAEASRGEAFASTREAPGLFMFGTVLASTRALGADSSRGTSFERTSGYGLLGGLGIGDAKWSVGAFVGYLNNHQRISALDARTDADGVVAGVHGRWSDRGFGAKATLAYDEGKARTKRALPDGSASSRYALRGWIGDISLDYLTPLGRNWTLRPMIGATAIRTMRAAVSETSNSAFLLDVARRHERATFVTGSLTFTGGERAGTIFKPYLTLGVRYQAEGRLPEAVASIDDGGLGLLADGAPRARAVAAGTLGFDAPVTSRLTLFGGIDGEAGRRDRRYGGRVGAKLAL